MTDATTTPGTTGRTLLRGGTVITSATVGEVLPDTDLLIGADGTIEAIGPGLDGRGRGRRRDRADRPARLRRHPPAHLAVGGPQRGLGLVAHGVPRGPAHRAQQVLPPRGHLRRQLPRRPRGARLRHHDIGRLVAQPGHPRPRRRRDRGPPGHRDAGRLRPRRRVEAVGCTAALPARPPGRRRPPDPRPVLLRQHRPGHHGLGPARSAVHDARGQRPRLRAGPRARPPGHGPRRRRLLGQVRPHPQAA